MTPESSIGTITVAYFVSFHFLNIYGHHWVMCVYTPTNTHTHLVYCFCAKNNFVARVSPSALLTAFPGTVGTQSSFASGVFPLPLHCPISHRFVSKPHPQELRDAVPWRHPLPLMAPC